MSGSNCIREIVDHNAVIKRGKCFRQRYNGLACRSRSSSRSAFLSESRDDPASTSSSFPLRAPSSANQSNLPKRPVIIDLFPVEAAAQLVKQVFHSVVRKQTNPVLVHRSKDTSSLRFGSRRVLFNASHSSSNVQLVLPPPPPPRVED